jgi:hypothetical protein
MQNDFLLNRECRMQNNLLPPNTSSANRKFTYHRGHSFALLQKKENHAAVKGASTDQPQPHLAYFYLSLVLCSSPQPTKDQTNLLTLLFLSNQIPPDSPLLSPPEAEH